MDNMTLVLLVVAAIILPICGLVIGLVVVIGALGRRNASQVDDLKTRWAAIAQTDGLTFNAGTALQDPSLTGTIDGLTVTLTLTRYRMGSSGMSHPYTVAWVPVAVAGECLIADRKRSHHVAGVSGPEVAIPDPGLAATHVARGNPERLARLLVPELTPRLSQNAITHVRLAQMRLQVQRAGHQMSREECLALMQLAADLAHRL